MPEQLMAGREGPARGEPGTQEDEPPIPARSDKEKPEGLEGPHAENRNGFSTQYRIQVHLREVVSPPNTSWTIT